jgi:hypothetical protein
MNTLSAPFIFSRPHPRLHGALGAALGALVAGLVLTGGQAKALTVTVKSQDYDVTTFTGAFNAISSLFTSTSTLVKESKAKIALGEIPSEVGLLFGPANLRAYPIFLFPPFYPHLRAVDLLDS